MAQIQATFLRVLHLFHRWSGIVLGALVLAWFISGVIMVFVARPRWNEDERLAALPSLSASALPSSTMAGTARQDLVSPWTAWQALGRTDLPETVRLHRAGQRVIYYFRTNEEAWLTVDASDGRPLTAADFTAEDAIHRAIEAAASREAGDTASLPARSEATVSPVRPMDGCLAF